MQNWPKSQEVVLAGRRHHRSLSLTVVHQDPTRPRWAGPQRPKSSIPSPWTQPSAVWWAWGWGTDAAAANQPQGWARTWPPAVRQEPAASAAVPTTSSCSKKYHRHTQDSSREILTYSTQGEFYFFLFRAEGVIRITKEGGVRKLGWTEQAVTPQGWPPRAAQGSGGHLGSATSPEVDGAQSSLEKVTLHVTSMIL